MLRVLTLSSLFPDSTRPNFGIFVEQQTLGLAAEPGVEVRVVAPVGLPPWPLRMLPHYRKLTDLPGSETWKGLPVCRPAFTVLPGTYGRFHASALKRSLIPLLDDMRQTFPFDVIDASFFFPDGPAAVALGRRYDVPVSIKARGADIHFWGRQSATAAQVRAAGLAADGLLAVSAAMRMDMAKIGLPLEKIGLHYTGVDLDRFKPLDRSAAKDVFGIKGPLVICVGALIDRKGHEIVVEALARLPGVSLLIAGEGPARGAIDAAVDRAGLGDRVRLLGAVPHADLPRLLAAADVMALASESEGLANAWVEALACGTPIVITEAGGAREVVTDPAAGRVVPRTPAAFAEAIAELLQDPPAPEATRSLATRFTWSANAAGLRAHLQQLVAKHRARR
ncbi:Glycosyltransferase involved in cell wall bisynthesis [Sphingomonas sp. OV641]|uniref:glycosyltransferase n=1 Tax=Sphingomonas sp. OV641 TaxID=1881068 RepID=UPI0008D592BB|nr:glycosyltransferase [Sphingomonas sp. OV641]SEJ14382.1 Glycosyltransferase involved in cell wall bisynthesis [Sphingomonas sp. OV641]